MITNIEYLRFDYEGNLLREIESRLGSLPYLDQMQSRNLLAIRKRILLGDAMLITADLLPDIHKMYSSCLNLFGNNLKGDLFILQSKEYNASIFAHNNKFDILINSALLEDFTLSELQFVIGHELGHVLLNHSRFSVKEILSFTEEIKPGLISPETKDLMYRWSRSAELSADRIGLLCCAQLETAVNALFKTSSGLSNISIDRILTSFRIQYDMLTKYIEKLSSSQSWISTHPMIPIRFKALELAALDIISLRHESDTFSWKGFRKIDEKIASILLMLDRYLSACNTI